MTILLARKVANKSPDMPGIKTFSNKNYLYKIKSLASSILCLTIDSEEQARERQAFEFIYKRLCQMQGKEEEVQYNLLVGEFASKGF